MGDKVKPASPWVYPGLLGLQVGGRCLGLAGGLTGQRKTGLS